LYASAATLIGANRTGPGEHAYTEIVDALRQLGAAPAVEASVARWRAVGRELGRTRAELEAYADGFEHPEREAARRLVGGAKR